jgi:hypothetical protein
MEAIMKIHPRRVYVMPSHTPSMPNINAGTTGLTVLAEILPPERKYHIECI